METTNRKNELKDRVEAKKHDLLAKLNTLKADAREESREQAEGMKKRLEELEETLKDGWENVSEKVSGKLNEWLKKD